MTGTKGKLDARVVAPSGAEDEAIIQELDKGLFDLTVTHYSDSNFHSPWQTENVMKN